MNTYELSFSPTKTVLDLHMISCTFTNMFWKKNQSICQSNLPSLKKTFMLMRCVILAFKLQQTWLRKNRFRSNLCTNGVARGKENDHSNPSPKELRRTPMRNGWARAHKPSPTIPTTTTIAQRFRSFVLPENTSLQQQYGKSLSSTPHIITHDIINEA